MYSTTATQANPQVSQHFLQQESLSQITADGGNANSSSLGSFVIGGTDDVSLQFVAGAQDGGPIPEKPTHRRKKSQQPTLMNTKQKQNSIITSSVRATTLFESAESQIRFEPEPPRANMHSGSHSLVSSEPQYLLSGSKRTAASTNSNGKERYPHHQASSYGPSSVLSQEEAKLRSQQPLSPKIQPFAALSQVRDKLSVGLPSSASEAPRQSAPTAAGRVAPPTLVSIDPKKRTTSHVKKLTTTSSVQRVSSGTASSASTAQVVEIPHHKRTHTKTSFPLSTLVGARSQKSGSVDAQLPRQLQQERHPSKLGGKPDMIKQLMRKHLQGGPPLDKPDTKAAYLMKHAKKSTVSPPRNKREATPPSKESSAAKSSNPQHSLPKRVTFDPKEVSESSQNSRGIREVTEEDEGSNNQMVSYMRDDSQEEAKDEAELIVDQLRLQKPQHHHRRSTYFVDPSTQHGDDSAKEQQPTEESVVTQQDAPTVVIDTSADEQDCAAQFRMLSDDPPEEENPSCQVLDNIQAALRSIRLQEETESQRKSVVSEGPKKKVVTIMTIEEEEALISQINEIRERIKRGETVGQQLAQQHSPIEARVANPLKRTIDYEDEDDVLNGSANRELRDNTLFNEYGGRHSLQPGSVGTKPPLYSLTFVHPDFEPHSADQPESSAYQSKHQSQKPQELRIGHVKQRSFHSIDNTNVPGGQINCLIVTDGPNIYEKKRQRFERIQRMRNGGESSGAGGAYGTLNACDGDTISSNFQGSHDGNTPMAGSSSCISGNYASLVKGHHLQVALYDSKKKLQASKQRLQQRQVSSKGQKPFASKSVQKQAPSSSIVRRSTQSHIVPGKSRQHSTVDQLLVHSVTTQSQYQNHYPGMSLSTRKLEGPTLLSGDLPEELQPRTHRPRHYMEESSHQQCDDSSQQEMQIQLCSLKKVMPGGGQSSAQIGPAHGERVKLYRPTNAQAALKKKLATKQRKGASIHIVNKGGPPAPQSAPHHKSEKSQQHLKNNLLINIQDAQNFHSASSHSLAHSLSLKRLRTPKLKDEAVSTPPLDKAGRQFQTLRQQQQPPSQSSSVKNHALNYQTGPAYKSPFVYAQTSKAAQLARQQPDALRVIDSRGPRGSSHMKQKSHHIASSAIQVQLLPRQSTRSGSLGSAVQVSNLQKVSIEPQAVNRLMRTKRDTDQAFDSMRRKLSETRQQNTINNGVPPQFIQPTKNISTASSGTTSMQHITLVHNIQGSPQSDEEANATRVGGSLMEFERNYRKLSLMLDKMFTL